MVQNNSSFENGGQPQMNSHSVGAIKSASTLCLLCGIWLFVSPWVYGAPFATAFNSWVVGCAIVILALVKLGKPVYSSVMSWCNMVLGAWVFFSPWIYGYTGNEGRFINSLCVGVIVFFAALASGSMSRRVSSMTPNTQHI